MIPFIVGFIGKGFDFTFENFKFMVGELATLIEFFPPCSVGAFYVTVEFRGFPSRT